MGKKVEWKKPGEPVVDIPGQLDMLEVKAEAEPEAPPPFVPELHSDQKMEVANPEEFGFDFRQNFQGGATPRLPQIGIVSAAQMFKCGEEKFSEFTGNILHYQLCNAFWKNGIEDGAGNIPECSSSNGIVPDAGDELQAKHCAECPMNKFGSDPKDGRGKWCKNMMRLHILKKGDAIPSRLTIPATSIRAADEFFTGLFNKKMAYQVAIVKFTLEKAKNKGGIEYSKIKMDVTDSVKTRNDMRTLKEYIDKFKSAFGEKLVAEESGVEHKQGANVEDKY